MNTKIVNYIGGGYPITLYATNAEEVYINAANDANSATFYLENVSIKHFSLSLFKKLNKKLEENLEDVLNIDEFAMAVEKEFGIEILDIVASAFPTSPKKHIETITSIPNWPIIKLRGCLQGIPLVRVSCTYLSEYLALIVPGYLAHFLQIGIWEARHSKT